MKSTYYLLVIAIFTVFSSNLMAQDEEVFKIVEQMPYFGTCDTIEDRAIRKTCSDESIYRFINQNINYPDSAYTNGTEGTVVVRFVIDKKGMLKDATVVKDIGNGCGEEALRVLNMMENWKSGIQKGKNVNVQMHLPVKFKIKEIVVQTEKFLTLNDLFCAHYLTDFVRADVIQKMAEDELVSENVCNVSSTKNSILSLKISLTQNGVLRTEESEDGIFTEGMRVLLRKVKSGDVLEMDYDFLLHFNENSYRKPTYKSIIVE